MSKDKDLLNRFGANLAESMGAGRVSVGQAGRPPASATNRLDGTTRLRAGAEIAVDRIIPDPNQPRTEFDSEAIARLAESLKTHGQLQPISVRWSEDMGRYLIVSGERRWRAATLAGRPTVSAVVVEGERTESQILEMQLIENCLREDLRPVEQAKAFRALMDRNQWPALRLAEVLHLNVASVTRALALLDLPGAVQGRVESGELAPSVAYEISKVEDPGEQAALAERVVSENLSRSETIEAVRQSAGKPSAKGKGRGALHRAKPSVLRTPTAKVTVELRKGSGPEAVLAALRDAVRLVEAKQEQGGDASASAA
jgi:ParB family chromosome partitioning protein